MKQVGELNLGEYFQSSAYYAVPLPPVIPEPLKIVSEQVICVFMTNLATQSLQLD